MKLLCLSKRVIQHNGWARVACELARAFHALAIETRVLTQRHAPNTPIEGVSVVANLKPIYWSRSKIRYSIGDALSVRGSVKDVDAVIAFDEPSALSTALIATLTLLRPAHAACQQ